MTSSGKIEEVVIIGAGLAGLTAAQCLADAGITARILEREAVVGQSWRRRHPQLTLNTHRDLSTMPGLRYPPGTPAFPKKDFVAAHLQDFVSKHRLAVEYGVDVLHITQATGLFQITTSNGGHIKAKHVVIATGKDKVASLPSWAGLTTFTGQILHSADLGQTARYAGKRVLVIGGGNSGFDVLNHLSRVKTAGLWMSVRGGSSVLPKRLFGFSVHRLSPAMARLPTWIADRMIALTQRIAFGNLASLGMPNPVKGAATRLVRDQIAIAVDDGAVAALKSGRAAIVPEVEEFRMADVIVKGGKVLSPDIVIVATGYSSQFRTLLPDLDVLDSDGRIRPSGKEPLSALPGLWFIGMRPSLVSYFTEARKESEQLARAISGK